VEDEKKEDNRRSLFIFKNTNKVRAWLIKIGMFYNIYNYIVSSSYFDYVVLAFIFVSCI
jgi:hypothetical protein